MDDGLDAGVRKGVVPTSVGGGNVGQNGFHLDSKEPDWSKFRDFIMGEVRYNSLMKTFPQEAEELFVATERNAKLRYECYKKWSEM